MRQSTTNLAAAAVQRHADRRDLQPSAGSGRWIWTALLAAFFPVISAAATPPATAPSAAPSPDAPEPLTTVASVRALTPAQAAQRLPVKLHGNVTYVSSLPPLLFVQDSTGGICVSGVREPIVNRGLQRPGTLVDIEGVTAAGRLTPYVAGKGKEKDPINLTVVEGVGFALPAARPATIADLSSPRLHGDLLELQGTVRNVRLESLGLGPQQDALIVTIAAGGHRLEAALLRWPTTQALPTQWIGAHARLRGVFNSAAPTGTTGAAVVMRLLMNRAADLVITTPATSPAKLALTSAASLDGEQDDNPRRIRLDGVVTLAVPGKGAYVQDDSGGIWVDATATNPPPKLGDAVEVLGFPARRDGAAIVEDSICQITGRGDLPDAPRLTADEALSGAYHARLVSLDALVLEVSRLNEGPTLVLQSGERIFLARLADAPENKPLGGVSENSWVRVTGVCVTNRLAGAGTAGDGRPVSFHLMLASPASVAVIRAPGWWTLERMLIASGVLLAVALAAIVWVVMLRRRVTAQTAQIRLHLHQQTVNEERMRIARELHDSLEQDLLAITMQLKATEKQLDRPDRAREALTLASAMVRRSQAETHRAVWDLRERKVGQEGLVTTLRSAVAGLTSGGSSSGGVPAVDVQVEGEERELPPQTENHFLRVALESVTNAFKHAGAGRVTISMKYEPNRVTLTVSDDGKGFDADHPPLPNSGHFGLFGMRERAAKLHGELTVRSRAGEGTQIRLTAPIGQNGNGKT